MSMQWGADAAGGLGRRGADVFDFISPQVNGTDSDDIIVAGGTVETVSAGDGDDIILALTGDGPVVYDGGEGNDIFIISDPDAGAKPTTVKIQLNSTAGTGTFFGDTVWFPDYPVGTVVTDLGGGVIEFSITQSADGTPGKKIVLGTTTFETSDGTPLTLAEIEDLIFFGPEAEPLNPDTPVTFPREILVTSTQTGGSTVEGTALSDFFFLDEGGTVQTGPGQDTVYADRSFAEQDLMIEIGPGVGKTVVLDYSANPEGTEAEECLIFDLTNGGVQQYSNGQSAEADIAFELTLITAWENPGIEVDTGSGKLRLFNDDDPDDVELIAIETRDGLLANIDDFIPLITLVPAPPPQDLPAGDTTVESFDDLG